MMFSWHFLTLKKIRKFYCLRLDIGKNAHPTPYALFVVLSDRNIFFVVSSYETCRFSTILHFFSWKKWCSVHACFSFVFCFVLRSPNFIAFFDSVKLENVIGYVRFVSGVWKICRGSLINYWFLFLSKYLCFFTVLARTEAPKK